MCVRVRACAAECVKISKGSAVMGGEFPFHAFSLGRNSFDSLWSVCLDTVSLCVWVWVYVRARAFARVRVLHRERI